MPHTPGPWKLEDDRFSDDVHVVSGYTRIVRFGPRENWDTIDAGNARLIAAAPLLLKACKLQKSQDEHEATCLLCLDGMPCVTFEHLRDEAIAARAEALITAEPTDAAFASTPRPD